MNVCHRICRWFSFTLGRQRCGGRALQGSRCNDTNTHTHIHTQMCIFTIVCKRRFSHLYWKRIECDASHCSITHHPSKSSYTYSHALKHTHTYTYLLGRYTHPKLKAKPKSASNKNNNGNNSYNLTSYHSWRICFLITFLFHVRATDGCPKSFDKLHKLLAFCCHFLL